MPRLSKKGLEAVIKTYVLAQLTSGEFVVTRENIAGMVDKIGKQLTLKGIFTDKLPELDGEELPLGKTIEEYFMDLVTPRDYTENVSEMNPLGNYKQTARKPYYSRSYGKKVIPITRPYNDIERACINNEVASAVVAEIMADLDNSHKLYKFNLKKALLRIAFELIDEAYETDKTYGVNTKYDKGDYVKSNVEGSTDIGVVMDNIPANGNKTFAERVEAGQIVVLDMVAKVDEPVDTLTGEAFIKQIKKDVEAMGFATEGTSLNGAVIGEVPHAVLYIKKGIIPELEVDTFAGAINKGEVAIPCEVRVVDDFNGYTDGFALLTDSRGIRLHPDWNMLLSQENAAQAWINYFLHTEHTGFVSRNTFMKKYVAPGT